jgi:hypothetical protein
MLDLGGTGVVRGISGIQEAEFTVTLSTPQSSAVTFDYATAAGTATPGVDFTSESGIATIAANTAFTHIQVPILPSSGSGPPLTYTLTISGSSGPPIDRATGTGTIYSSP